jgi:hypothetical protein
MARVPQYRQRQLPRRITQGIQSDLRVNPQVNSGPRVYMNSLLENIACAAKVRFDGPHRSVDSSRQSPLRAVSDILSVAFRAEP